MLGVCSIEDEPLTLVPQPSKAEDENDDEDERCFFAFCYHQAQKCELNFAPTLR